jgi:hypothetical protein
VVGVVGVDKEIIHQEGQRRARRRKEGRSDHTATAAGPLPELPVFAKCPSCGRINAVDLDEA